MSADSWVISEKTEQAILAIVNEVLDQLLPPGDTSPDYGLVVLHYLSGEVSRRRRACRRQRDRDAAS